MPDLFKPPPHPDDVDTDVENLPEEPAVRDPYQVPEDYAVHRPHDGDGQPRIRMSDEVEMQPEDPEDDMPLSELMELRRRREEELRPS